MAKDDYHVVVYQILSYLYQCLKTGIDVDGRNIAYNSKYLGINERYWRYVMHNLLKDGLIEGIVEINVDNKNPIYTQLDECMITPKGIEFLTDNSFMRKAVEFLKDTKAMIPFV